MRDDVLSSHLLIMQSCRVPHRFDTTRLHNQITSKFCLWHGPVMNNECSVISRRSSLLEAGSGCTFVPYHNWNSGFIISPHACICSWTIALAIERSPLADDLFAHEPAPLVACYLYEAKQQFTPELQRPRVPHSGVAPAICWVPTDPPSSTYER